MVEASPVKFYFAKFFFLALALIQWAVAGVILFQFGFTPKIFFAALIFLMLGLVSLFFFMVVSDRIKRVAVGKNKIVVIEGHRNIRFEWPEVKSLKVIPFFNLYKLKIKGKRKNIYFFPSQNIDPTFSLLFKANSKMGEIVSKRKKELGIQ